jgi:hypothetical protein
MNQQLTIDAINEAYQTIVQEEYTVLVDALVSDPSSSKEAEDRFTKGLLLAKGAWDIASSVAEKYK